LVPTTPVAPMEPVDLLAAPPSSDLSMLGIIVKSLEAVSVFNHVTLTQLHVELNAERAENRRLTERIENLLDQIKAGEEIKTLVGAPKKGLLHRLLNWF